jgi:hypothetical protein
LARLFPVLLLLAAAAEAQSGPPQLRLVDDLGAAITSDLQICFQVETKLDCASSSTARMDIPSKAASVRVEGPGHGPVSVRREALAAGPDGVAILKIPRKAFLDVAVPPGLRLAVSLYPQNDATFRAPSFRIETKGAEAVRIPSGDHVVSLTAPGRAPDLHLLSAVPAERRKLQYRERAGWSLVLRSVTAKDGAPLEGTKVEIRGTEGFSASGVGPRREVAGRGGITLLTGLTHSLASAILEHVGYARRRAEGLSASPGTFAFREIPLEKAATLRATVRAEGKPVTGASCQIIEYEANSLGPVPEPTIHSQGKTDAAGTCRSTPLSPGSYRLRLTTNEQRSRLERAVELVAGEEIAVEIDLVPIRVYGNVLRGSKPAIDHVVVLYDADNPVSNATRRNGAAEAVTDEEGKYEALLWTPGSYFASLETANGTPADGREIWLDPGEEQQVDFNLDEHTVAGTVMDERDRPVAEASVGLRWNKMFRLARTDEHGAFQFPLPEPGEGKVEIRKAGYRTPPPVEVSSQPGMPPSPVVVRLRRAGLLAGGIRMAGINLVSFTVGPGLTGGYLGSAVSDREGRFEIAAAEESTTRLFATGPGCPLASFDLGPTSDEVALACPDHPASLELQFVGSGGAPVVGKSVLLRRDGILVPNMVLIEHLGRLRLPAAADGSGRLLLPALAPGRYELFLADATSPELIAAGSPQGFLAAADLSPLTTTELQVELEP